MTHVHLYRDFLYLLYCLSLSLFLNLNDGLIITVKRAYDQVVNNLQFHMLAYGTVLTSPVFCYSRTIASVFPIPFNCYETYVGQLHCEIGASYF